MLNFNAGRKTCAFVFVLWLALSLAACNAAGQATAPAVADTPAAGTAPTALPSQVLKIKVGQAGMVEISGQELQRAGFPVDGVANENWLLTWRGQPAPLWVEGQGRQLRLRFYAQPADSLYVAEAAYLLRVQPPDAASPLTLRQIAPISTAAATVATETQVYSVTQRLEQNLIYSPQVVDGDHWLWLALAAPARKTFEFELKEVENAPAQLSVALWSSNSAPANPDHRMLAHVNGQQVFEQSWDGIGSQQFKIALPAGLLKPGKNEVVLEFPGDTGAPVDLNNLNWLELTYPRRLKWAGEQMRFTTADGPVSLDAAGADLDIFEIRPDASVAYLNASAQNGSALVFNGSAGSAYVAVSVQSYHKPASLELALLTPDLQTLAPAEYLAIGPAALLEPLQPLLAARAAQGLSVQAIPLEAVVDQFGGGFLEPAAVHQFLVYASQNWPALPRYVLLVGDASYDPLAHQGQPEGNQLPTYFVFTTFGGETGSDLPYADMDGDKLPDLALGRLPARTPAQVAHFVEKTLAYEQSAPGDWQSRILSVADGQEAVFRSDAEGFLQQLPAGYTSELYAPEAGAQDGGEKMQNYLSQGYLMVSYFGHGSINMWGKDRLFLAEQAAQLQNQNLPVFMTMTCLNGLYIHPKIESLAEALLWAEQGGAVSVLAPTSLTTSYEQSLFRQPFVEALFHQDMSLGQALLTAQRLALQNSPAAHEVVETFILFGDPALRLKIK